MANDTALVNIGEIPVKIAWWLVLPVSLSFAINLNIFVSTRV